MTRSQIFGMVAVGAFLVWACGGTAASNTSSSSHWIECGRDLDCESVSGAVACEAGYCVDRDGERIENDRLGAAGGPGVGASDGGSAGSGSSGGSGSNLTAGGGDDQGTTNTGGSPLGFTTCEVDTAMATCEGTICHGSPGAASASTLGGGLDLFREDRETWLVDRPATYQGVSDPERCPAVAELLVDTENPNDSLIIKKIEGRQECGITEPFVGADRFADEDRECLTDWVLWLAGEGQ